MPCVEIPDVRLRAFRRRRDRLPGRRRAVRPSSTPRTCARSMRSGERRTREPFLDRLTEQRAADRVQPSRDGALGSAARHQPRIADGRHQHGPRRHRARSAQRLFGVAESAERMRVVRVDVPGTMRTPGAVHAVRRDRRGRGDEGHAGSARCANTGAIARGWRTSRLGSARPTSADPALMDWFVLDAASVARSASVSPPSPPFRRGRPTRGCSTRRAGRRSPCRQRCSRGTRRSPGPHRRPCSA